MKTPTVTVYVRPSGSRFLASSYESNAIDPHSPHEAARKCGARHLGVEPAQVEVIETDDEAFVVYMGNSAGLRSRSALWWAVGFFVVSPLLGALLVLLRR